MLKGSFIVVLGLEGGALPARVGNARRFHPVEIVMVLRIGGGLWVGREVFGPFPFVRPGVSIREEQVATLVVTRRRQVPPLIGCLVSVTWHNQGAIIDAVRKAAISPPWIDWVTTKKGSPPKPLTQ